MSAETPALAAVHHPLGTHGLWGDKAEQLPAYIQNIARALMRAGHSESSAISIAVGRCKVWAAGGGGVSPEVRVAAAAAVAEWERLKSMHVHGNDTEAMEMASVFNSALHPKAPAGSPAGGQFVPVGQARNASAAKSQANTTAQADYAAIQKPGGTAALAGMKNGELENLSKILYSYPSSNPGIVKARIAVANELSKRGLSVTKYGALGTNLSPAAKAKKAAKSAAPVAKKKASVKVSSVPATAAGPQTTAAPTVSVGSGRAV